MKLVKEELIAELILKNNMMTFSENLLKNLVQFMLKMMAKMKLSEEFLVESTILIISLNIKTSIELFLRKIG